MRTEVCLIEPGIKNDVDAPLVEDGGPGALGGGEGSRHGRRFRRRKREEERGSRRCRSDGKMAIFTGRGCSSGVGVGFRAGSGI